MLFWSPDVNGNVPKTEEIAAKLVWFAFDFRSDNLDLPTPEILHREDCEFSRINMKFFGRKYEHAFMDLMDPSLGTDFLTSLPRMGVGLPPYNCLAHLDYRSSKVEKYFPGRTNLVQETIFIPRQGEGASEGDGWVIALVYDWASMSSELHIVDTRNFDAPQAIINLPIRLRAGLHENWVGAQ